MHSSGNLTLTSAVIGAGKQITVYVDGGDVAITGNITYNTAGWTDRSQIPSLKLIVHGVVYIGKDVTALNGLYAAIPDSGYDSTAASNKQTFDAPKRGTISTCSTGFDSYDPTKILTTYASMNADCSQRLTVTGSVVAAQVWLLRSYGTLGSTPAAEVFEYAPEVWLAPGGGANGSAASPYQSIVALPPTL
jgi:hypothetical protein